MSFVMPSYCAHPPVVHGMFSSNTPGAGSFVVPAGITSLEIRGIGASGGSGASNSIRSGSGSGGGAEFIKTISVSPGDIINYDIGAGGAGSVGTGTGGVGGDTTVPAYSLVAGGGAGGKRNDGSSPAGGVASGGDTNNNGNAGQPSQPFFGGAGGDGAAPDGGTGGLSDIQGTAPGGGSGGSSHPFVLNGVNGADGGIIFIW